MPTHGQMLENFNDVEVTCNSSLMRHRSLYQLHHLTFKHVHELTQISLILIRISFFRVFPVNIEMSNTMRTEDGGNLNAPKRRQHLLGIYVDVDTALPRITGSLNINELVCTTVTNVLHQIRYTTSDTETGVGRVTRLQHATLHLPLRHCNISISRYKLLLQLIYHAI